MKVIVDELPDRKYNCLFSKWDYGCYSCTIKKDICDLECNRKCEMLLSLKEMKGE